MHYIDNGKCTFGVCVSKTDQCEGQQMATQILDALGVTFFVKRLWLEMNLPFLCFPTLLPGVRSMILQNAKLHSIGKGGKPF